MTKSSDKIPVSCFIIACNEEERIARTISSIIDWVDEVILIDSGSTDKTIEIAGKLGARIIFNKWAGYGPQKRFGEEQCSNDWLLNIDADEVITPALQKEIRTLFEGTKDQTKASIGHYSGYHLRVIDILPGREKPLPLASKYNIVRLYNQRKVRYSDSQIHDRVETAGQPLGQLIELVHHHSILSISQIITKLNSYSDLQAKAMKPKGLWKLKIRLVTEFPLNFLRIYFLRGYFMGGSAGLTYSMVFASFRFFRVAKMLEKLQHKQHNR